MKTLIEPSEKQEWRGWVYKHVIIYGIYVWWTYFFYKPGRWELWTGLCQEIFISGYFRPETPPSPQLHAWRPFLYILYVDLLRYSNLKLTSLGRLPPPLQEWAIFSYTCITKHAWNIFVYVLKAAKKGRRQEKNVFFYKLPSNFLTIHPICKI
jgi:hypothetical protein